MCMFLKSQSILDSFYELFLHKKLKNIYSVHFLEGATKLLRAINCPVLRDLKLMSWKLWPDLIIETQMFQNNCLSSKTYNVIKNTILCENYIYLLYDRIKINDKSVTIQQL